MCRPTTCVGLQHVYDYDMCTTTTCTTTIGVAAVSIAVLRGIPKQSSELGAV